MSAQPQNKISRQYLRPIAANWRASLWLLALCAAPIVRTQESQLDTSSEAFRIGFSTAMLSDVNESDAKASMRGWAQMVAKELGWRVEPDAKVLQGAEDVANALRSNRVDAVSMTIDEYWKTREAVDSRFLIAALNEGQTTEEYLILVHKDSGINRINELRGRSLVFWKNMRMNPAPAWLDTLMIKDGSPPAAKFCRLTQNNKLAKVVLPVFFRQADACMVTRRGFKNMSELNPQIGQRLKVLIASPELIPCIFCFRQGYNNQIRDKLVAQAETITRTPSGAQFLALFQSGGLKIIPDSSLDSTIELLATHERLSGGTNRATATKLNLVRREAVAGVPQ
jgi:ABC-type phosphate/phosphonate transport system substrate-binding protein